MSTAREQELLGRLESLISQVDRIAEQTQREDAERDEQRAEAARSGQLGPDWQDVQRRIDTGETSLRDVFGGQDDSPAAACLRGRSRANLETMAGQADLPQELTAELAATEVQWQRLRAEGR
jgi:hypothetical protein